MSGAWPDASFALLRCKVVGTQATVGRMEVKEWVDIQADVCATGLSCLQDWNGWKRMKE